jgi:hypothetical protein
MESPRAATVADAASDRPSDGEEAVPSPPPPPLRPHLTVPAPSVLDVRTNSARVEWQQATVVAPSLAEDDDPRQAEVQAVVAYSVPQGALEMQEVPISASTASSGDPQAQLEQAKTLVAEEDWRTVHEAPCCSAEVRARTAAAASLPAIASSNRWLQCPLAGCWSYRMACGFHAPLPPASPCPLSLLPAPGDGPAPGPILRGAYPLHRARDAAGRATACVPKRVLAAAVVPNGAHAARAHAAASAVAAGPQLPQSEWKGTQWGGRHQWPGAAARRKQCPRLRH